MMDFGLGGLFALFAGFLIVMFFIMIAVYVYMALALMTIANKTKTENSWLAWIPIANIYLMTQVAGVSGWITLAVLLPIIPFVGSLGFLAIFAWIWWKIAEKMHRPEWWGILIAAVPIVNLVLIGMLAWGKK